MAEFNKAASVPGVVQLFGGYSTIIGEPAIAIAIDLRVNLKVEPAEFDFFIVDGYKLDAHKHKYFSKAAQMLWHGKALEFNTSSQLPMVTGFGTQNALVVALAALLMNKNEIKKNNLL